MTDGGMQLDLHSDKCDCIDCREMRADEHHICIFVGVDDHDECEVCGRQQPQPPTLSGDAYNEWLARVCEQPEE